MQIRTFTRLALITLTGLGVSLCPEPGLAQRKSKPAPAVERTVVSDSLFNGLRWRNIGPFRAGRSLAVAGHPDQPLTYYFGATGGGVWKTVNGGASWMPISDNTFSSSSVGAITVAPSDPNVLYVGMGEPEIRGNISFGDGVYKSTDGGKTWKHVGLRQADGIGNIVVHPRNPDIAYVAALGNPFAPNRDRGVFRTRDGGKSWEKILQERQHRGSGRPDGSRQSVHSVCFSLAGLPQRVLHEQRWARLRPVQIHRWRRQLGFPQPAARYAQRPAGQNRPGGFSG